MPVDNFKGVQNLVSIVIPTYNAGIFLKEAVESALNQDYDKIEIIVVDDGSNDGSLELLDSYRNEISIISSDNLGAASARNIGILASSGEFIAFLDSDDKWSHNKIRLQVELLLKQSLDLVYCAGQEFSSEGGLGKIHLPLYEGDCYQFYRRYPSRDIVAVGPSGSILRKDLLHKSGIFDTKIPAPSEDWDFFRRYSQVARFGYCTEVLVYRRIHSNNISRSSIVGYYLGNRSALLKMFADDPAIGYVERRRIWSQFHFMTAKAFAKKGLILPAFAIGSRIIFPRFLHS